LVDLPCFVPSLEIISAETKFKQKWYLIPAVFSLFWHLNSKLN
jgi:hypothetical protein